MKTIKSFFVLSLIAVSTAAFVSCGSSEPAAKLDAAYITPSQLTYMNVRPNYNYYITTFSYESLELYSDSSYIFTVNSATYSGLVLPEVGNGATGSARDAFTKTYYGTFTSADNSLDADTLDVTISAPTRYTFLGVGSMTLSNNYFYDSANWTEDMNTKLDRKDESENPITVTGEDYLKENAFVETTVSVSKINFTFDYFVPTVAE